MSVNFLFSNNLNQVVSKEIKSSFSFRINVANNIYSQNRIKLYTTNEEKARYNRRIGFVGVGLLIGGGAVLIPSIALITYGSVSAIEFSTRYPYKRNDVTTNPQYYVPLYVGAGLLLFIVPGLFGSGLGLTIFGFVKAYKYSKKTPISLILDTDGYNVITGIQIKL